MHAKVAIFSVVLALAAISFAKPPRETTDERHAVEQANATFYTSLNAMFTGDVAPMQQVWSHADDVTFMGPAGGFQVGWEQVNSVWEQQAALKLGGKVEPAEVQITLGTDLAIVQCYELGQNLDTQGRPIEVSIRATNVFRNEQGAWKMISHHTDLLPALERRTARRSTNESQN